MPGISSGCVGPQVGCTRTLGQRQGIEREEWVRKREERGGRGRVTSKSKQPRTIHESSFLLNCYGSNKNIKKELFSQRMRSACTVRTYHSSGSEHGVVEGAGEELVVGSVDGVAALEGNNVNA